MSKNTFFDTSSKATTYSFLVLFFLLFTGMSGQIIAAEYYGTGGLFLEDMLVDAHGSGSTLHERVDRNSGQVIAPSINDSQMILGPKGEYAKASYAGSLANGKVDALVQAVNAYDHNDDIWGETMARTYVQLFDTIYFTVPAGTYADGVTTVATGYVTGSMSDSLYGQSRFSFSVNMGREFVLQDAGDHTAPHSKTFNENFTLTNVLVQPGTTLTSDLIIRRSFTISLGVPATLIASTYRNKTGQKQSTSALVDFYHSGGILDFSVTEGVTWRSASGVLFSELPQRLTVTLEGTGIGSVSSNPIGIDCGSDCSFLFDYGTDVTLTAKPKDKSKFAGWSGACTGTDLTCTVTMDQAQLVSAQFKTSFPWASFLGNLFQEKDQKHK